MTRQTRILLGCAAFWPLVSAFITVALVLFAAFFQLFLIFFTVFSLEASSSPPPVLFVGFIFFFFAIFFQLFSTVVTWGMVILYMVIVLTNDRHEKDLKIFWAIMMFFGGWIAMVIYWYLNIWREPPTYSEEARNADSFIDR